MNTYRAALLTRPRCIELGELEVPPLARDEVLVRVRSANLCPTDVKKWQDDALAALLAEFPLVLGHEIAGDVVAIGDNVTSVDVGDRVALDPVLPCGTCAACRDGRPSACSGLAGIGGAVGAPERNARLLAAAGIGGGFAELVKAPHTSVIPIPDGLSYAAASLIEPLADVLHGITAIGDIRDRRCAVYGLGPMGLLHVQALVYLGAHVVGVDPREDRRETARALGAHSTVEPEDVPTFDRAFIVAGGPGLLAAAAGALDALGVHGALVLFASGSPGVALPVDPNRLHYQRQRIIGVVGFEPAHARLAIELLVNGAIAVDLLRTPKITLEDLQSAFETIGAPGVLKPAIDFGPA